MTQLNDTYLRCIQACQECILRCEECIKGMASEPSHNDCPVCCHECAQVCQLCVSAMARDSRNVKETCALGARVCEWCAEQCGSHDHDHCQRCAESCRACATECREIAA